MKRIFRKSEKYFVIACLIGLSLLSLFALLPVVVNTTPSLPEGIYLKTQEQVERGKIVVFCPPQEEAFFLARKRGYLSSGFCEGGMERMIKHVAGVSGDNYSISAGGITINGQLLAQSAPLTQDPAGRLMPIRRESGRVPEGKLILYSGWNSRSFDSRYFGVVDSQRVQAVIRPLLTQ